MKGAWACLEAWVSGKLLGTGRVCVLKWNYPADPKVMTGYSGHLTGQLLSGRRTNFLLASVTRNSKKSQTERGNEFHRGNGGWFLLRFILHSVAWTWNIKFCIGDPNYPRRIARLCSLHKVARGRRHVSAEHVKDRGGFVRPKTSYCKNDQEHLVNAKAAWPNQVIRRSWGGGGSKNSEGGR